MNSFADRGIVKRNFGIDFLRMLAMFMVAILHILGQGGVLQSSDAFSSQYEVAWLLEIAAYCAVNCYALISGYVGVSSKYRYSSIIILWMRVVFYTIIITAIYQVVMPDIVSWKTWVKAFCPVLFQQYWYFTSYCALFFFVPILNLAVNKLSKKQLRALVLGLVAVFSILPTVFCTDAFGTAGGYTAWWLMILYLIGGYIRKYGVKEDFNKIRWLWGYVIMVVLTWLSKLVLELSTMKLLGEIRGGNLLISYTSPTIILAAIALLLFFEKMKFSDRAQAFIRFFSPLAFSVYLIHVQPLVWITLIGDRFSHYASCSAPVLAIVVLLTALVIYFVCSIIDILREKLFEIFKVRARLESIEEKYIGTIWNTVG